MLATNNYHLRARWAQRVRLFRTLWGGTTNKRHLQGRVGSSGQELLPLCSPSFTKQVPNSYLFWSFDTHDNPRRCLNLRQVNFWQEEIVTGKASRHKIISKKAPKLLREHWTTGRFPPSQVNTSWLVESVGYRLQKNSPSPARLSVTKFWDPLTIYSMGGVLEDYVEKQERSSYKRRWKGK